MLDWLLVLAWIYFWYFFFRFNYIVTGLNVSEFIQMYEILEDPIACEMHGASRERQTSRVVCVGL